MNKKTVSKVMIGLGGLLIVAALFLTIWNITEERSAGRKAEVMREAWIEASEADRSEDSTASDTDTAALVPDYVLDPDMEMPTRMLDGVECIGMLEIPTLAIELPVISEWSYEGLRVAPCRYQGSVYRDDIIIAAHNYSTHFGQIGMLAPGDEIRFTDAEDRVFCYEVVDFETLDGGAVEEMSAGQWDLTLFTCTLSGQARVTVRCRRIQTDDGVSK